MMSVEQPQGQNDSRREAIVNAAARVFAEKGFSGTSNREVAREAGISPGLIYWYFQDKEELFKTVVGRLFPLYALEFPKDSAGEMELGQLLHTVGSRFTAIMTHPEVVRLARLAITEMLRFPEVFQEIGRMVAEQAVGPLAEQLDARIERGELPPIDTWLASQAFFGTLMGYVIRKHMYQSADLRDTSEDEMVAVAVRIFTVGLVGSLTENTHPDSGSGEPDPGPTTGGG